MTSRTITAIYDSEADANIARDQLLGNGLDDDDVRIVGQNLQSTSMSTDTRDGDDKGIWESIKEFFVGEDDRPVYSEGLRRGGYLLTARVEDDLSDQAIAVLEQTNAVDLDQRTEQWRTEGWSEDTYVADRASLANTELTDTQARGDMRSSERTSEEQSIPVVEERLRVGKREVDRGGVRVRSYVVEEPVHDQVSLREERVEVERRPASDRAAARGGAAFEEQTIELNERGEEAVIAKDSVVTEEVVIRQTAEDRVQDIDETVRRTQVDVEDTRTGKGTKPSSSRNRR